MNDGRKLFVEMTAEEYEKYRDFQNGKYIPIEGADIGPFLEAKGYEFVSVINDAMTGRYITRKKYRKGRTVVLVEEDGI